MNPYIKGLKDAAEIAAVQAADDALAADAAADLGDRLNIKAQQERALAIQKKILEKIGELKEIRYVCPCKVEHVEKRGVWGFFDGEEYPGMESPNDKSSGASDASAATTG